VNHKRGRHDQWQPRGHKLLGVLDACLAAILMLFVLWLAFLLVMLIEVAAELGA
jgi:hypothetical protein